MVLFFLIVLSFTAHVVTGVCDRMTDAVCSPLGTSDDEIERVERPCQHGY